MSRPDVFCAAKDCDALAVILWVDHDLPLCQAHHDEVVSEMSGQWFTNLEAKS